MLVLWYICDGEVEEYYCQEVNWDNSVIVLAATPEDALLKLMRYHLGRLSRVEIRRNNRALTAIV